MGKYYDRLIKINENLDKEMLEQGVSNADVVANDTVVANDKTTTVVEEDSDGNTIEIPKDSLTPEQKKDILLDKGVDQKTIDNLKDDNEIDGALDATLNNDEVKKESSDDIDESVIVRMDDDDLNLHGFVKSFEDGEVEWTDDEAAAQKFQHKELGQDMIEAICSQLHYDPATFSTKSVDPRADEPYVENDNGENWISIDSMNPSATTLP